MLMHLFYKPSIKEAFVDGPKHGISTNCLKERSKKKESVKYLN